MDDRGFVDLVHRLDDSVASVDGGGFRHTPLLHLGDLGTGMGHTGGLFGKDETGNVSGSHKARHLFGLALHLAVDGVPTDTPLAIASCGNAALGAAVVARATGRPLAVHVPTWADPEILDRLADLGADVRICERRKGGTGDPCVLRFRELVTDGAIPFGCQGTENLMTIDGGRTLGFELASDLADRGAAADHLLIHVGGGALDLGLGLGLEPAQAGLTGLLELVHLTLGRRVRPRKGGGRGGQGNKNKKAQKGGDVIGAGGLHAVQSPGVPARAGPLQTIERTRVSCPVI